jgi:hypothetical protein
MKINTSYKSGVLPYVVPKTHGCVNAPQDTEHVSLVEINERKDNTF